jgi:hypothetical protein
MGREGVGREGEWVRGGGDEWSEVRGEGGVREDEWERGYVWDLGLRFSCFNFFF